jgi:hypothetical protein
VPKHYDCREWSRATYVYHAQTCLDPDYDPDCEAEPKFFCAHHSMTRHLPSAASMLLNCWYRRGCPHPEAFDEAVAWLEARRHLNAYQLETEAGPFLAGLYAKHGDPKAVRDVDAFDFKRVGQETA